MNGPQTENNFNVDVKNFGPIAEANIELRPLTVFVGPSNVGKSYLAILVYALHRALNPNIDGLVRVPYDYRSRSNFSRSKFKSIELTSTLKKTTRHWIQSSLETELPSPMPNEIQTQIQNALQQPTFAHIRIKEEIKRCFNVADLDDLIRLQQRSSEMRIKLGFPQTTTSDILGFEFLLNKQNSACIGTFGDIQPIYSALVKSKSPQSIFLKRILELYSQHSFLQESFDLHELLANISDSIFKYMLQPIQRNAYYLPAARTGIMDAHRVVVSALLQGASKGGSRPSTHVPALPGIMSDFLDQLYNLREYDNLREYSRQHRNTQKITENLAEKFESNILKGGVQMDASYEYSGPNFSYKPDDLSQALPFARVSSMVSELAPIVLYLRYLVNPGDTLIIEEPESHLHPAMQAELALELARMVRHGIRIIVTTHSEWFLEKIGNLVRLSEVLENSRYSRHNENVALHKGEVGAWLFKQCKRPKGSKVEEIQMDPETGLFPTDYGVVSEALYNEGAEIFNKLSEIKNEQIG